MRNRLIVLVWLAAAGGLVTFSTVGWSDGAPSEPTVVVPSGGPARGSGAAAAVVVAEAAGRDARTETRAAAAGSRNSSSSSVRIRHLKEAKRLERLRCRFDHGRWVGNLTWVPTLSDAETRRGCVYRTYSREDAFRCLGGTSIVLYGNSNVRALYSALEGVLKDRPTTPRLEAKQTCENNRHNHSCGMEVSFDVDYTGDAVAAGAASAATQGRATYQNVSLFYWGWVNGAWGERFGSMFQHQQRADLVIGNTGVNVIQKYTKAVWTAQLAKELPRYKTMAQQSWSPHTKLLWMTTTRICEAQPHFRRYTYHKKFWLHRPLDAMNGEIDLYNEQHVRAMDPSVSLLDAAQLVKPSHGICPHYDDPLHHKAVDKVLANVVLNMYCNAPP